MNAGEKSYQCKIVRGRGSKAPVFRGSGKTEAEAIADTLRQMGKKIHRASQVSVSAWTHNGRGFMFSDLLYGSRTMKISEAREIARQAGLLDIDDKVIAGAPLFT